MEYGPAEAIEFPSGLPAFESEKRFLMIERPEIKPVVFLQSLSRRDLCFVTLPVAALDSRYELSLGVEDWAALAGDPNHRLPIDDLIALAILSVSDSRPTANLLAPVVINRRNRRAVQAIRMDSKYSHQCPVGPLCS